MGIALGANEGTGRSVVLRAFNLTSGGFACTSFSVVFSPRYCSLYASKSRYMSACHFKYCGHLFWTKAKSLSVRWIRCLVSVTVKIQGVVPWLLEQGPHCAMSIWGYVSRDDKHKVNMCLQTMKLFCMLSRQMVDPMPVPKGRTLAGILILEGSNGCEPCKGHREGDEHGALLASLASL